MVQGLGCSNQEVIAVESGSHPDVFYHVFDVWPSFGAWHVGP